MALELAFLLETTLRLDELFFLPVIFGLQAGTERRIAMAIKHSPEYEVLFKTAP
jgi:hypothetical protein